MGLIFGSIRRQVFAALSFVIGAMLILLFFSVSSLDARISQLQQINENEERMLRLSTSAAVDFKEQIQDWKNVLLRGKNPTQNAKYWSRFRDSHDRVQSALREIIKGLDKYPAAKSHATDFLSAHTSMLKSFERGKREFENADFDHVAGDKVVSGIDREPSKLLDALAEELVGIADSEYQKAVEASSKTFSLTLVVSIVVSLGIMAFVYILIGSRIITPILELVAAISKLAAGDCSYKLSSGRTDELGVLATNIESLRQYLSNLITDLNGITTELSTAAALIREQSEGIQIGAEQQRDKAELMATATQELTHSAEDVAKNASLSSEGTTETHKIANSGVETMNSVNSAISALVTEIGNASGVVEQLANDATSVGSVLGVIKGIAEQTNLLALNAAIEAARAGEQGRGFAVVADEVRTLAQKTQESTEEIQRILENLQAGAVNAVKAMTEGKDCTEEVTEQVEEATKMIDQITGSINHIAEMNLQVATAAEQQTHVTHEIADRVTEVSEIANHSAEAMAESVNISGRLNALADDLSQKLSGFKLS